MSEQSSNIRQRILDVAGAEFLACGYPKTSMRSIAAKVGVTATALYRHFTDKEELFAALLEPVLAQFREKITEHDKYTYDYLVSDNPEDWWEPAEQEFLDALAYVYDHFNVFKLLLCCSSGTKYSQFQHELVEGEVRTLLTMIDLMREKGHPVKQIDARTLHLLLSGFFSSIFEMIIHDYSRAEAEQHIRVLSVYFCSGLRAVLGI